MNVRVCVDHADGTVEWESTDPKDAAAAGDLIGDCGLLNSASHIRVPLGGGRFEEMPAASIDRVDVEVTL